MTSGLKMEMRTRNVVSAPALSIAQARRLITPAVVSTPLRLACLTAIA
jgi:hypothetical protein